jgi:molybdopterin-guanine dinucleotide biosynthesis protein A
VVSSVRVTGIVLAGDSTRRSAADATPVEIGGRPILLRAILAVASVADEVVVVIAPEAGRPPLPSDAAVRVRVVRAAVGGRGPIAALAAGLAEARGDHAILVGGDQPGLSPALLDEMLLWLDSTSGSHALDVVVVSDGGTIRPVPAALRVSTVCSAAAAMVDDQAGSLVGLFERLRVGTLEPERWRLLDPQKASLRGVDTPENQSER